MTELCAPRSRAEDEDPGMPANTDNPGSEALVGDLEACPRCGVVVREILWGYTNCPRCGLHFECC